MSEQVVRAHTSQSNRAKARANHERKVVFKSVVDSPFCVQWPSVPVNIQNAIIAWVVDVFTNVAEYNLFRERASRKKRRLRESREGRTSKKTKSIPTNAHEDVGGSIDIADTSMEFDVQSASSNSVFRPPVLRHATVGINEVTRRLETLARSHRKIVTSNATPNEEMTSLAYTADARLVIACRADIDPPILIGHLPNLVAACNSMHKKSNTQIGNPGTTWLVPLSKGAESTLAETMGLRRVSVMLIEGSVHNFSALAALLQNVPLLSAPWLCSPTMDRPVALIPTHIKQLRTSAPKDMKAAKEKRSRDRAAAKARRQSRQQAIPKRVTISTVR